MLKVERRIRQLEAALGPLDRARPFVHRIIFLEGDGTIAGTLVLSDDPVLCQPFKPTREMVAG
jgi:hypothetical protein